MDETQYKSWNGGGELEEETDMELEEFVSDKDSLIDPGKENAPLRSQQSVKNDTIFGFDGLRVIIVSSVVVSLAITAAMVITILIGEPQVPPHGAVVSGNQECSDAGVSILKKGGSAVDAAIAASLCVGVTEGQSSGIGGGGFMLILDAEAAAYTGINFREMAPENATINMFAGSQDKSLYGGLAVGVPGELAGMRLAWERFGKLTWRDLFQPAIQRAHFGFKASVGLVEYLKKIPFRKASEDFKKVYAPDGVIVKEGERVFRTNYGDLLERIANKGIQEFYDGSNAREIASTIVNGGGILSEADLQNYKPRSSVPVNIRYRDYNLVSLPEPSGGPSLLTLINVLELFNLTSKDKDTSLYYHRLIEAVKFVKAQEIGLGDSSLANYSQQMMSKENAQLIFANITDDETHPADYYFTYAQAILKTKGTSQISVIDTKNNMVSVTTSVNRAFGSLLMTPSGVILNNHMNDFDWPGKTDYSSYSKSNYIAPGKQPQSHMAPVMGRNATTACARRFTMGAEGGSDITAAITEVIMELLAFHSSLDNATVPLKRVYPSLDPNTVKVEAGVSEDIVADLQAKKHDIDRLPADVDLANVNTIMKENDIIYAKSDPREIDSGASQY